MDADEVPLSQRGRRLLWFDHRLWHCRCTKVLDNGDLRKYWRCQQQGCCASLSTDHDIETELQVNEPITRINHIEFCKGDEHLLEKHLAIQRFKLRSASSNPNHSENWRRLANELDSVDANLINLVGTKRQMQHVAHYQHRKNQPKIRRIAAHQTFPREYSLTRRNEQFLLYIGIDENWLPPNDYELFFSRGRPFGHRRRKQKDYCICSIWNRGRL